MQAPQNNNNTPMENQTFGYMSLGNVNMSMNLSENTTNANVKKIKTYFFYYFYNNQLIPINSMQQAQFPSFTSNMNPSNDAKNNIILRFFLTLFSASNE